VSAHAIGGELPTESGYTEAFAIATAAIILSLGAAFLVPGRRERMRTAAVAASA
jgi:hypothetical protein